jgi:hypothetical protein
MQHAGYELPRIYIPRNPVNSTQPTPRSGRFFSTPWGVLRSSVSSFTERFTRAFDQLGATDDEGGKLFEIRIGGIYAFERIARESEEDYWPIMEFNFSHLAV